MIVVEGVPPLAVRARRGSKMVLVFKERLGQARRARCWRGTRVKNVIVGAKSKVGQVLEVCRYFNDVKLL